MDLAPALLARGGAIGGVMIHQAGVIEIVGHVEVADE